MLYQIVLDGNDKNNDDTNKKDFVMYYKVLHW